MATNKKDRVYTTVCYGCKKEITFNYNAARASKASYKGAEEYLRMPCPHCGEIVNQRVDEKSYITKLEE